MSFDFDNDTDMSEDSYITTAAGAMPQVQGLGHRWLTQTCADCKSRLLETTSSLVAHAITQPRILPSQLVRCKACSSYTCVDCGASSKLIDEPGSTCCDGSYLFQFYLWLSALEILDGEANRGAAQGAFFHSKPMRKSQPSDGQLQVTAKGIGYEGDFHSALPVGAESYDSENSSEVHSHTATYSDSYPHQFIRRSSSRPPFEEDPDKIWFKERRRDLQIRTLISLSNLLARWQPRTAQSDHEFQLLRLMFQLSTLGGLIASLLRVDSIDVVMKERDTYVALCKLLLAIAEKSYLSPLLASPSWTVCGPGRLIDATFSDPSEVLTSMARTEKSSPVVKLIDNLLVTSRSMLQYYEKTKPDVRFQDMALIGFCEDYIHTHAKIVQFIKVPEVLRPSKSKAEIGTVAPLDTLRVATMADWHRKTCVRSVDDEVLQQYYSFNEKLGNVAQRTPGGMRRLFTEISTLRNSLPEGIFVCHGESRLDMIKVLIVGPLGTPYERGLFEFDIFCPSNYPASPPLMTFRTTDGGRAHFNPNLYQCGKVCLSLINTWSGPGWVANESSLLQVFVSIQGMVFCDEPWYNEPGRRHFPDNVLSEMYNDYVRHLTVPVAMTAWIRSLISNERARPIWGDIVAKHFRTYGKSMTEELSKWLSEANELGLKVAQLREQRKKIRANLLKTPPAVNLSTQLNSPGDSLNLQKAKLKIIHMANTDQDPSTGQPNVHHPDKDPKVAYMEAKKKAFMTMVQANEGLLGQAKVAELLSDKAGSIVYDGKTGKTGKTGKQNLAKGKKPPASHVNSTPHAPNYHPMPPPYAPPFHLMSLGAPGQLPPGFDKAQGHAAISPYLPGIPFNPSLQPPKTNQTQATEPDLRSISEASAPPGPFYGSFSPPGQVHPKPPESGLRSTLDVSVPPGSIHGNFPPPGQAYPQPTESGLRSTLDVSVPPGSAQGHFSPPGSAYPQPTGFHSTLGAFVPHTLNHGSLLSQPQIHPYVQSMMMSKMHSTPKKSATNDDCYGTDPYKLLDIPKHLAPGSDWPQSPKMPKKHKSMASFPPKPSTATFPAPPNPASHTADAQLKAYEGFESEGNDELSDTDSQLDPFDGDPNDPHQAQQMLQIDVSKPTQYADLEKSVADFRAALDAFMALPWEEDQDMEMEEA